MSSYKTFKVHGSSRYMKDGKLISQSKLSPQILKVLSNVTTYDDSTPEPVASNNCIFCGEATKLTKFINLQTIPICEKHYYDKTSGQVVQELRKKENALQVG